MSEEKENNTGRNEKGHFIAGNKFGINGRSRIYNDAKELSDKIIEYFDYIQGEWELKEGVKRQFQNGKVVSEETYEYKFYSREPEPPTITGLSLYLGFSTKSTLYDYCKRPEFKDDVQTALMFVENNYEKGLWGKNVTGIIFALKNMGWSDKTETKLIGDSENPIEVNQRTMITFTDGLNL